MEFRINFLLFFQMMLKLNKNRRRCFFNASFEYKDVEGSLRAVRVKVICADFL